MQLACFWFAVFPRMFFCGTRRKLGLKKADLHSLVVGVFFLIQMITVMESSAQYCGKGLKNTELCI